MLLLVLVILVPLQLLLERHPVLDQNRPLGTARLLLENIIRMNRRGASSTYPGRGDSWVRGVRWLWWRPRRWWRHSLLICHYGHLDQERTVIARQQLSHVVLAVEHNLGRNDGRGSTVIITVTYPVTITFTYTATKAQNLKIAGTHIQRLRRECQVSLSRPVFLSLPRGGIRAREQGQGRKRDALLGQKHL